MTYQELYDKIVAVKDKYSAQILAIEGVHGIGVKVQEQKIIVYVYEITPDVLLRVPTELDGFVVECKGGPRPTTFYGPSDPDFSDQYRRPVVAGRSISRTHLAGAGTLTGIFWSEALQKHVGHGNQHVLALFNQGFKRQDTNNTVSFTVQAGGTPFLGEDLKDNFVLSWRIAPNEKMAIFGDGSVLYGQRNGTCHIDSISPASARAGEVVTLRGNINRRYGYSKVIFGDVETKVKTWTSTFNEVTKLYDSVVEVYVPEMPIGSTEVKINLEGEAVFGPAMGDGGNHTMYEVGHLEDWIPIVAPSYNDSALFTFNLDKPINGQYITLKGEYKMEPAMTIDRWDINPGNDNEFVNSPIVQGGIFPGREYRMQGVYRGPFYEGMCVMKTGRTTGTTFGIVEDPSWDWQITYPDADWNGGTPVLQLDCVTVYAPVFIDAMPYVPEAEALEDESLTLNWYTNKRMSDGVRTAFADAGDSGSGIFTASYEDYVAYCNKYGIKVIERRPDLPPDPPAGLLVCTETFGGPYDSHGGGDKAYRYIDYYGLSLNRLPMEIAGETATASDTRIAVTLYTEWSTSPKIKSVSSVGLNIQQGVIWSAYPSIQSATSVGLNIQLGVVWHAHPAVQSTTGVDITIEQGWIKGLGPTNLVRKNRPQNTTSINFTLMVYLREITLNATLDLMTSTKMSVSLVPPVPVDLRAYAPYQATPVAIALELLPVAVLELKVINMPVYTTPAATELSVKAYKDLNAVIRSTSSVIAVMLRGTVIPMIPTELVSQAANLDIKNIDFSLKGYGRAINAKAPLFTLPTSVHMIVDQVFIVSLRAASPMTVLPSSTRLQINAASVAPVGLSASPRVGPTVKANVELVVKLLPFFLARPDREMEVQAIIGSTTYDKTEVVAFDIEDSLIPSEEFVLGSVISSRLTFTIRTSDTIASNASISPYVRLRGPEGVTDWVPLGKYYVDTRGYQNNVWTFTCFDKLILSQQTFVSALTYPASMAAVFAELRGQLGLTADASVVINPAYTIPYKDLEITMREMLGYIASAHGASIRLTKDTEQISFVKFKPNATRTNILASEYFHAQQTNPLKTFTKIQLTYNTDGEFLTAGSGDEDHTLNIYNPFMSQTMLNTVFTAFNGFSYMPFTMDWKGNPTINVGASVTVTERSGSTFPTVVLTDKSSYKGGLKSTITAPSYSTQRSETDYKGGLKQFVNSQLAKGVQLEEPYYGVTIGRANGIKIEKSDGVSKAYFNSDKIEIARNGSPVFKVNSDGYVELTGVKINGGTITWGTGGVNTPTAAQVGALPATTDLSSFVTGPELSTTLGQNYVITGLVRANRIEAGILTGFTIQTALSGSRIVLNSSNLTGYDSGGYTSVRLSNSSLEFWGSGSYAGYYAGKVYGSGYTMRYDATNAHIFYVGSNQVFNVGSYGSTSFLMTDLSLLGDVTANKFHGMADSLGAPSDSEYASIGPASQHTFYHSLGRIPVVVLSGTLGNVMLTQSVSSSSVTVYNHSTGGNTWSGTIYVW